MRVAHLELVQARFRQTQVLRRADYLRDLVVTPAAAKEVRVFGLGGWLVGRFRTEWERAVAPVWRRRRASWWDSAAGVVPLLAVVGAVAAVAVAETTAGRLPLGQRVVVLQAIP